MITISPQRIPQIFSALSQFRLGDEFRFTQLTRSREDFVDDGWRRAAAEAGLDHHQRFASSCLFIAQFIQAGDEETWRNRTLASVGFYLHQDPERWAGQIYLARSNLFVTSAMRLIRLNPSPPSDFPSADPFLLSIVTYSEKEGPRSHTFVRLKDLWTSKNNTANRKRVQELSSNPSFFITFGGLRVSTPYNTSGLDTGHPVGRMILEGDVSAAVAAHASGWPWVLAEVDETWTESADFWNARPLGEDGLTTHP